MTPSAALASNVFLAYAAIMVALLAIAGLILGVLGWVLKKDVSHAWQSYRGWLIMIPLLLGCIFLGRAVTIVFLTVVTVFAFKEYARATGGSMSSVRPS